MKILQVCAVDFTLYHFLLPLIGEFRRRGHHVTAACADGPFVEHVRASDLKVELIPFSRNIFSLSAGN